MSNHDPTLNAMERLVGVIESIERRVQQLEKKSETQRAALLDAFRQIDRLKERVDSRYLKIRKMEESINKAAPHPTTDEPDVPPVEGEAGKLAEWLLAEADLRRNVLSTPTGLNLAQAARQADKLQAWATLLQAQATELARLRSRAALVPVEGEAGELPANYIDPEHQGDDRELLRAFYQACNAEGGTADEIHLRGIRAVLATELAAWRSRAALVPVPVGERLPGAADCDALGRCWWFGPLKGEDPATHSYWALFDCPCSNDTHWLPHWAIAAPQAGEVEG